MVGGNDILEFEEKNIEQLEEDFLMQYSHAELKEFILNRSSYTDTFKDDHEKEWFDYVEESFSNYGRD